MPDEEMHNIDKLIREAANQHHPAYDAKALEKMVKLLDKHLPQKKERGRMAFFLLLTLFLTGGALFTILYPWKKSNTIVSGDTQIHTNIIVPKQNTLETQKPDDVSSINSKEKKENNVATKLLPVTNANETKQYLKPRSAIQRRSGRKIFITSNSPGASRDLNTKTDGQSVENNKIFTYGKENLSSVLDRVDSPKDRSADAGLTSEKRDMPVSNSKDETNTANTKTEIKKSASSQNLRIEKTKKSFANNFAITFSGGPDLSFINIREAGKASLYYGAGLSYAINHKITIRSGFYVAKKIYAADPYEYHPPEGYWTYNADLQRVDADCKVYEIPLSISYNFKQAKHHVWFGALGISSYLMKRETYNYLYKDQLGQTQYKGWTLLNKNKHYFSVMTISGGYQYLVNTNFSLMVEPYFKLPLNGVGFGKIKLNSAGLLVTAGIKPFAKRK